MFYVDVIYKGGVFCMWLKRKMENIAYLNSEKENVNIILKEKKKSDTMLFVMFIKSSFLFDSF